MYFINFKMSFHGQSGRNDGRDRGTRTRHDVGVRIAFEIESIGFGETGRSQNEIE
jgi:hypothetical protein